MASVDKCISCGATLEGGGKSGKITCPYCGTVNKVEKEPARKDVIVCAVCSSENELDAQHCSQCGADLYFTCPKCRTLNTADAVHCKKCGANLSAEIKKFKQALEAKRAAAQKNKKRWGNALIRIGLAVLVIGAFGAYIDIHLEALFTGGPIIISVAGAAMIVAGFLILKSNQ